MIERRVFGPPGTGKTTKLATEIIPDLAAKYGEENIMITSFTKAAAQELGSRINIIDSQIIGTLHSICFNAMGCPVLTETNLKDWNSAHPALAFNLKESIGKKYFAEYQVCRNKMIPRDSWRPAIKTFGEIWDKWKSKNMLVDFMDLIEESAKQYSPPGQPDAIVIDEAQDFTRLEMSTLRYWASQVKEFWIVGDDDQGLYSFSGADPRNMLLPEIDDKHKIILDQSWRIPKSVHVLAEKLISRVSLREPKKYLPRDVEGQVHHPSVNFNDPKWVVDKALSLEGTSMILATCHYMLDDMIAYLRNSGIPFANPWRAEDKRWNPLNTIARRILTDFMDTGEDDNYWNTDQFLSWAGKIKVGPNGLIRKQGKQGLKALQDLMDTDPFAPGLHTCREYLDQLLSPDAIEPALNRDTDWLKMQLQSGIINTVKYPLRVLKLQGKEALFEKPRIYIGTVHSVKGAEADNVFLYPDISYLSKKLSENREGRDDLCRLFYVGVTRAKNQLFLMSPGTRNYFEF